MVARYRQAILLANRAKDLNLLDLANIVFAYLYSDLSIHPSMCNPHIEWETQDPSGRTRPGQSFFDLAYIVMNEDGSEYELCIPATLISPLVAMDALKRAFHVQIEAAQCARENTGVELTVSLRGQPANGHSRRTNNATPEQVEELWQRFVEIIDPAQARQAVWDVLFRGDARGNEFAPRLDRLLCERFNLENPPAAPKNFFLLSVRHQPGTNRWEELGIFEAFNLEDVAVQLGRGLVVDHHRMSATLTTKPGDPGEYTLTQMDRLTSIPPPK